VSECKGYTPVALPMSWYLHICCEPWRRKSAVDQSGVCGKNPQLFKVTMMGFTLQSIVDDMNASGLLQWIVTGSKDCSIP